MTTRRSRGEGGLHWDETRQRWIATATLGFDGRGKRITRKASGKTNTEAKARLREILREHEDGVTRTAQRYSVEDAVRYWLTYGLAGVDPSTVRNYTNIAERHVIPKLGARQLAKLAAQDVDGWLRERSLVLSTRTLRLAHYPQPGGQARDGARSRPPQRRGTVRDPRWQEGRRSKSLTLDQADKVLTAAGSSDLHAYVVLSLLIRARAEELRVLRWAAVDLDGRPDATPPIPPSISVLRSVRRAGDTKTTQVATSARIAAALCPGPPRTSGQARSPTRRG